MNPRGLLRRLFDIERPLSAAADERAMQAHGLELLHWTVTGGPRPEVDPQIEARWIARRPTVTRAEALAALKRVTTTRTGPS